MDVLDGGPAPDATTRRDAGSPRLDAGPGGDGSLCSECDTHGDCAAGHYCVALTAGGNACLPACIGDLPECPRDFRCVTDIGAGIPDPLCQPVGKPCCLDEDEDGYGHGVGCLGLDCDDRDSSVHAGQSEICNGRDDDCDGAIDEGCPSDVGLGVATNGTSYGGSGGSAFTSNCPAGGVLTAISIRAAARVDAVAGRCRTVSLATDTTGSEHSYSLATSTTMTSLPSYGGTGGSLYNDSCGPDEVVIGIDGRSGTEVDRLSFACGKVALSSTTATITPVRTSPNRGGTGGSAFSYRCPAGQVAVGLFGRTGRRVDRIGLRCAPVNVTLR